MAIFMVQPTTEPKRSLLISDLYQRFGVNVMGKLDKGQIVPLSLDTLRSCPKDSPLIVGNGEKIDEEWAESGGEESPLVHFVTPLFKFLRICFMTHSAYEYDSKERIFVHKPGSILRKIVCCTLQVFAVLLSLGEGKMVQESLGPRTIVGLYRVMGIAYVALITSFHYGLMCKGNQVRDMLNFTQSMTCCIAKLGCKIPKKKIIKPWSTLMLVVYFTQALLYTMVNVDGSYAMSVMEGSTGYFGLLADQAARRCLTLFTSQTSAQLMNYKFSEQWKEHPAMIYILGFSHLLLYLRMSFCWVMGYLMLTMWGLLFWKVLHNFFAVIASGTLRNTLEDIRKFNKITGIIDMFNKAFGWTVLSGLVAGVLHFSVYIVDLFQVHQMWTQKAIIAAGLVTLGIMLLASAQVNHAAGNITEVMKGRYQEDLAWHDIHGKCTETTQGMMLIIYEVQTSKIGFRGLGFFTITYSFIGTVLSLISTYSLVVMQMQNQNG